MFYVNKKRAKIQNTKHRIERSTFFGQWKKYIYFSEDMGPLCTYEFYIHRNYFMLVNVHKNRTATSKMNSPNCTLS